MEYNFEEVNMDFPTLESFDRSTVYWRGGGQLPHQQRSPEAWSVWPRNSIFAAKRRKTNSRRILEGFLPTLHFFMKIQPDKKSAVVDPPLSSQTINTRDFFYPRLFHFLFRKSSRLLIFPELFVKICTKLRKIEIWFVPFATLSTRSF